MNSSATSAVLPVRTGVDHAVRFSKPVLSFDQARELSRQYGTPTIVISKSTLTNTYRTMKAALPNVEMFYAAKANSDVSILRPLFQAGSSVDVCSYRELQSALLAGFSPDQMIHTHPCKTIQNLMDCYNEGVRWFTVDCSGEIDKLVRYTPDVNVILRLAAASTSSLINLSAKFGCDPVDAPTLAAEAGRKGLKVRCLSFHVGSQCLNPEDFRTMLTRARQAWDQCVAAGAPLEVLDIGGGFPAPYRTGVMSLSDYCRHLSTALDATFGDLPIRIIAEPGRGMCAEAATLITRVVGKSVRGGLPWYFLDEGIYGSFSGKLFDYSDFELIAEAADARPRSACIVAGPTCDSHDVVSTDQELPELEVGELLLVPTMGAYTSASASGFNGLDIARVVEID
ncbi:MAG: type III PLP-dependent enzyme [Planctomycetota bacterium]|nr:type III PLP-dependent enzyme [Planctomycetota bacterium]MDA1158535.1 type III PLP-dependent enzyme [Planctomycetota bacterium]